MSHLVDTNRHSQNNNIVLARIDLYSISVANAKPLFRDLGHLIPALADGVFVIQNITLNLKIGAILDLDCKSVAYG